MDCCCFTPLEEAELCITKPVTVYVRSKRSNPGKISQSFSTVRDSPVVIVDTSEITSESQGSIQWKNALAPSSHGSAANEVTNCTSDSPSVQSTMDQQMAPGEWDHITQLSHLPSSTAVTALTASDVVLRVPVSVKERQYYVEIEENGRKVLRKYGLSLVPTAV
ncbi:MAG: uncharacterized protein KVP18_004091 [Porospora cf. gigantea A]|uniref:uncharacterized protein n=1 Tax=Porospora cf. gigantea A TaxID=2853593 RepID=UPI00355AC48D|nr:MAG: hypothetical protein KVP18_004091 [Porospora cf. gigantea A]